MESIHGPHGAAYIIPVFFVLYSRFLELRPYSFIFVISTSIRVPRVRSSPHIRHTAIYRLPNRVHINSDNR